MVAGTNYWGFIFIFFLLLNLSCKKDSAISGHEKVLSAFQGKHLAEINTYCVGYAEICQQYADTIYRDTIEILKEGVNARLVHSKSGTDELMEPDSNSTADTVIYRYWAWGYNNCVLTFYPKTDSFLFINKNGGLAAIIFTEIKAIRE